MVCPTREGLFTWSFSGGSKAKTLCNTTGTESLLLGNDVSQWIVRLTVTSFQTVLEVGGSRTLEFWMYCMHYLAARFLQVGNPDFRWDCEKIPIFPSVLKPFRSAMTSWSRETTKAPSKTSSRSPRWTDGLTQTASWRSRRVVPTGWSRWGGHTPQHRNSHSLWLSLPAASDNSATPPHPSAGGGKVQQTGAAGAGAKW